MDSLPKACVILGAGASKDIVGEGSALIAKEWEPPLAKDLFQVSRHTNYQSILTKYPRADFLVQNLAPKISSGQISVEKALRKYAEHPEALVRASFKHIPPYIRDLIYASNTDYTHSPSSYAQLVMGLLADHPHDLLFIVLNYDNYLELALSSFNPEYQFDCIDKYTTGYNHVKVVKLHGSINWFKQIGEARDIPTWIDAVKRTDILAPVHEGEILVLDKVRYTAEYRTTGSNRWVYPVLTAPLAGKNTSDAVCPKSHISELKLFLGSCKKFLIIGTSGLDEDLMALIDSELGPDLGNNHLVHMVNYQHGAEEASTRFRQNVRAFKDGNEPAYVSKVGFRVYLNQPSFQAFAEFGLDRG